MQTASLDQGRPLRQRYRPTLQCKQSGEGEFRFLTFHPVFSIVSLSCLSSLTELVFLLCRWKRQRYRQRHLLSCLMELKCHPHRARPSDEGTTKPCRRRHRHIPSVEAMRSNSKSVEEAVEAASNNNRWKIGKLFSTSPLCKKKNEQIKRHQKK